MHYPLRLGALALVFTFGCSSSSGVGQAATGGTDNGGGAGLSSGGGVGMAHSGGTTGTMSVGGSAGAGMVGVGGTAGGGGAAGATAAGAAGAGTAVGGTAGSGGAANAGMGGGGGAAGGGAGVWLVHADFQARAPGVYAQSMVAEDFGHAPAWNNGLTEGRATIEAEGAEHYLRVTYPANQYGPAAGGVQFKVPLGQTYGELYFAYRVRFGAGFQFVKGGKLPGLVGGTSPTGCVTDSGGFSARGMWRTGGAAVQYLYYPDKVNACGDDFDYMAGGTAVTFQAGTWHQLQERIVMNTAGAQDGLLQAWFDGKLVLNEQTFRYRLAGAQFGVDALYFSTFFGGSDASWAPNAAQTADFDDLIVSTKPIAQ